MKILCRYLFTALSGLLFISNVSAETTGKFFCIPQEAFTFIMADYLNFTDRANFARVSKNSNKMVNDFNEYHSIDLVQEIKKLYINNESPGMLAVLSKYNAFRSKNPKVTQIHANFKQGQSERMAKVFASLLNAKVIKYELELPGAYRSSRVLAPWRVHEKNVEIQEREIRRHRPFSYQRARCDLSVGDILAAPIFGTLRLAAEIATREQNNEYGGEIPFSEVGKHYSPVKGYPDQEYQDWKWEDQKWGCFQLEINRDNEDEVKNHSVFKRLVIISNNGKKPETKHLGSMIKKNIPGIVEEDPAEPSGNPAYREQSKESSYPLGMKYLNGVDVAQGVRDGRGIAFEYLTRAYDAGNGILEAGIPLSQLYQQGYGNPPDNQFGVRMENEVKAKLAERADREMQRRLAIQSMRQKAQVTRDLWKSRH